MRTRPTIPPGELFRMLKTAFDARRPPECLSCRIPMLFAILPSGDGSPNWRMEAPRDCPQHCSVLIAELAAELASRYDMKDYALAQARSA